MRKHNCESSNCHALGHNIDPRDYEETIYELIAALEAALDDPHDPTKWRDNALAALAKATA